MANEVVYYSSDETGAPTLNNAAGSMVAVLDACLKDGFNAKSVTGIVVASGLATATISAHGLATGRLYDFGGSSVTGGTPGALNGRQRITVVDANTVTFPAPGVANQTATGTITGKRPALGWTKPHSGTNKAIYQRSDPAATAMLLRIDDTGSGVAAATYARAVMVESASGIDTYDFLTPTAAQLSGGQYWSKGANDSGAKAWILVGDGKTFYFWTEHSSYTLATYGALHFRMFGDISPFKPGDAYCCAIAGDNNSSAANTSQNSYNAETHGNNPSFATARLWNGIDLSAYAAIRHPGTSGFPIGSTGPGYPSPVDNGMVLIRPVVTDYHSTFMHPSRGVMRGLLSPVANVGIRLHKRVLSDLTGFDGDALFVATMAASTAGAMGVDLTGPWG